MADLSQIVQRLEATLGALEAQPVPLEGGITNRNLKATFGGRTYVIRLPGKDTSLLGISREAEQLANAAAARLGIAPAVALAGEECVVTEYVAGRPLDPRGVSDRVELIAERLRAFHESGTQLPVRFWVPDLLDSYAAIVRDRGGTLPDAYRDTHRLAQRIGEVLPLRDPAPCHNDLLPANILAAGDGVALVDWDYAGIGHRVFDLGNLAVNNEFDPAAEERLLGAYWREPATPSRLAALRLMKIMSDAREAAWGVIQGVISELDFDFAGYAQKHFDRIARNASDPALEEWLGAAAT